MESLVEFANNIWNLWLGFLFIGLVIYTLWPTKKRSKDMEEAANIPFMDKSDSQAKGV